MSSLVQNLAEICVRSINAHFQMICDTYSAFLYPDSKHFQNLTKKTKIALLWRGTPYYGSIGGGMQEKSPEIERSTRDLDPVKI